MKIAVIGAGIAGLSAGWLLSQKHNVKLYEKNSYFGGHSNTQIVPTKQGDIPVDTGFIIFNQANYPNLTALFEYLDVETTASEMSFSYSLDKGKYEYSGKGLKGLFGQKSNLLNPSHWRMIRDILRFFKDATKQIEKYPTNIQLDAFLEKEGYSSSFVKDHILPMAGAIWSAPNEEIKKFPAKTFLNFYANHGLLQAQDRPLWRSVLGGSKQYVSKLIADSKFEMSSNDPVAHVNRLPTHVEITTQSGQIEKFDQVVFACHADETVKLLSDANVSESSILGNFKYSNNHAILHTDKSQMPARKRLWSSWNYLENRNPHYIDKHMSVSYWMNNLQKLETDTDVFVTINPKNEIDKSKVIYQTDYSHPVIDLGATNAQKDIWTIQGHNRSWYCGSYLGYGFHEDGLQSGLAVAEILGNVKRPWNVENESSRIHSNRYQVLEAAK